MPSPWIGIGERLAARTSLLPLPELHAHYSDRVFRIPAADSSYEQVFFDDGYEAECTRLLQLWLRAGDLAVDVGAHHGWFSLVMAAAVRPGGKMVAFEPIQDHVEIWRHNAALNPQLALELRSVALGRAPGTLQLHRFEGLPGGHTSAYTLGREDFVEFETPVTTLDDEFPDEVPTVIKLDVEGHELEVLGGAVRLLSSPAPPSWLIEINHDTSKAAGHPPDAIVTELARHHDYAVYRIGVGGVVPERDASAAPHGDTWFLVSRAQEDRVPGLLAGGGTARAGR